MGILCQKGFHRKSCWGPRKEWLAIGLACTLAHRTNLNMYIFRTHREQGGDTGAEYLI